MFSFGSPISAATNRTERGTSNQYSPLVTEATPSFRDRSMEELRLVDMSPATENGTSGEEKLGEISGDADVQIATGNTLWQILRCEEDRLLVMYSPQEAGKEISSNLDSITLKEKNTLEQKVTAFGDKINPTSLYGLDSKVTENATCNELAMTSCATWITYEELSAILGKDDADAALKRANKSAPYDKFYDKHCGQKNDSTINIEIGKPAFSAEDYDSGDLPILRDEIKAEEVDRSLRHEGGGSLLSANAEKTLPSGTSEGILLGLLDLIARAQHIQLQVPLLETLLRLISEQEPISSLSENFVCRSFIPCIFSIIDTVYQEHSSSWDNNSRTQTPMETNESEKNDTLKKHCKLMEASLHIAIRSHENAKEDLYGMLTRVLATPAFSSSVNYRQQDQAEDICLSSGDKDCASAHLQNLDGKQIRHFAVDLIKPILVNAFFKLGLRHANVLPLTLCIRTLDRTDRTSCVVGALERWLKAAKKAFDCEGNQGEKALASKGITSTTPDVKTRNISIMKGRKLSLSSDEVEIIIPSGDMKVSSERQRNSKTNILNDSTSYWETNGPLPHWVELNLPLGFEKFCVRLEMDCPLDFPSSYYPERVKVTAKNKKGDVVFEKPSQQLPESSHGSTITLFESKDVTSNFSNVTSLRLTVESNWRGGLNCRISRLRLVGSSDSKKKNSKNIAENAQSYGLDSRPLAPPEINEALASIKKIILSGRIETLVTLMKYHVAITAGIKGNASSPVSASPSKMAPFMQDSENQQVIRAHFLESATELLQDYQECSRHDQKPSYGTGKADKCENCIDSSEAILLFDSVVSEVLHSIDEASRHEIDIERKVSISPTLGKAFDFLAYFKKIDPILFDNIFARQYIIRGSVRYKIRTHLSTLKFKQLEDSLSDTTESLEIDTPSLQISSVQSCVDAFLCRLEEIGQHWKHELKIAQTSSMPGWSLKLLHRAFESHIIAPIRKAVSGDGTSKVLPGLKTAVRAILHEYLVSAPLVSPAAIRARNTLAFMTGRLAQTSFSALDSMEHEELSLPTKESATQVEHIWRDLLVNTVKQLLLTQTEIIKNTLMNPKGHNRVEKSMGSNGKEQRLIRQSRGTSPESFVSSLTNFVKRIRRIQEILLLPSNACRFDKRAFSNAYVHLNRIEACHVVQRLSARAHTLLDRGRSNSGIINQRKKILDELADLIDSLQCAKDLRPFYVAYLARRLLRNRSHSTKEELSFLLRADEKEDIPAGRRMLRDATLSYTAHEEFVIWYLQNEIGCSECDDNDFIGLQEKNMSKKGRRRLASMARTIGIEATSCNELPSQKLHPLNLSLIEAMKPIIATRSAWPSTTLPLRPMRLAPPMQSLIRAFDSFYRTWDGHNRSSRKKLLWCPTAGTVTLVFRSSTETATATVSNFDSIPEVNIVVTTIQSCLLLLFTSERKEVSFAEFLQELSLEADIVYAELRALLAPQQQILLIARGGNFWRLSYQKVEYSELLLSKFVLNEQYLKIMCRDPAVGDDHIETIVVHEVIDAATDYLANANAAAQMFAWRMQLIEAAAVRVMKCVGLKKAKYSKPYIDVHTNDHSQMFANSASDEEEDSGDDDDKIEAKAMPLSAIPPLPETVNTFSNTFQGFSAVKEASNFSSAVSNGDVDTSTTQTTTQRIRYSEWANVIDMVCRECRQHFDVSREDVGQALDKLCLEGILLRRQKAANEFIVTELALKPPEVMANDMKKEDIYEVLGNLPDTTSVTGVNLFRLLAVKFRLPIETATIDRPTFETGILDMLLHRRLELHDDMKSHAIFPVENSVSRLEHLTWNISVGALMSVLPRAVTAAFADDISALLAQAGIMTSAVMPALSSETPLLPWKRSPSKEGNEAKAEGANSIGLSETKEKNTLVDESSQFGAEQDRVLENQITKIVWFHNPDNIVKIPKFLNKAKLHPDGYTVGLQELLTKVTKKYLGRDNPDDSSAEACSSQGANPVTSRAEPDASSITSNGFVFKPFSKSATTATASQNLLLCRSNSVKAVDDIDESDEGQGSAYINAPEISETLRVGLFEGNNASETGRVLYTQLCEIFDSLLLLAEQYQVSSDAIKTVHSFKMAALGRLILNLLLQRTGAEISESSSSLVKAASSLGAEETPQHSALPNSKSSAESVQQTNTSNGKSEFGASREENSSSFGTSTAILGPTFASSSNGKAFGTAAVATPPQSCFTFQPASSGGALFGAGPTLFGSSAMAQAGATGFEGGVATSAVFGGLTSSGSGMAFDQTGFGANPTRAGAPFGGNMTSSGFAGAASNNSNDFGKVSFGGPSSSSGFGSGSGGGSGTAFGQTGFGANPTRAGAPFGGNMTSSGFAGAASNNSGGFRNVAGFGGPSSSSGFGSGGGTAFGKIGSAFGSTSSGGTFNAAPITSSPGFTLAPSLERTKKIQGFGGDLSQDIPSESDKKQHVSYLLVALLGRWLPNWWSNEVASSLVLRPRWNLSSIDSSGFNPEKCIMPEMTKDVNTKWSGLSSESISDIFATSAVGPGTKAMTFDNFLDDLVSTIMNTTPFIPVGNSTVSFDFLVANICAHVFELVAEIVDELSMLLSSTNSEDGQSYDQKQTYGKRGERLYSPAETDEQVSKTSSKPLDRDSGESEEGIPSTSGSPPPPKSSTDASVGAAKAGMVGEGKAGGTDAGSKAFLGGFTAPNKDEKKASLGPESSGPLSPAKATVTGSSTLGSFSGFNLSMNGGIKAGISSSGDGGNGGGGCGGSGGGGGGSFNFSLDMGATKLEGEKKADAEKPGAETSNDFKLPMVPTSKEVSGTITNEATDAASTTPKTKESGETAAAGSVSTSTSGSKAFAFSMGATAPEGGGSQFGTGSTFTGSLAMSSGSPFTSGAATSAFFGASTTAAQPRAANGIGPAAPMGSSGPAFGQTGFGANLSAPTPNTGTSLGGNNMTFSGFAGAASNISGGFRNVAGFGGSSPSSAFGGSGGSSGTAFGQTGFGANLSAPTPNTGTSLGGNNMTSSGFAAAASNVSGGFRNVASEVLFWRLKSEIADARYYTVAASNNNIDAATLNSLEVVSIEKLFPAHGIPPRDAIFVGRKVIMSNREFLNLGERAVPVDFTKKNKRGQALNLQKLVPMEVLEILPVSEMEEANRALCRMLHLSSLEEVRLVEYTSSLKNSSKIIEPSLHQQSTKREALQDIFDGTRIMLPITKDVALGATSQLVRAMLAIAQRLANRVGKEADNGKTSKKYTYDDDEEESISDNNGNCKGSGEEVESLDDNSRCMKASSSIDTSSKFRESVKIYQNKDTKLCKSPTKKLAGNARDTWMQRTFDALDYCKNKFITPDDFDLNKRREILRNQLQSRVPEDAVSKTLFPANSEGAMALSEPPAPRLRAQLSTVAYSPTDAIIEQNRSLTTYSDEDSSLDEGARAFDLVIASLAETLSIPLGEALILLGEYKWNRKLALDAFISDDMSTRRAAGLPLPGYKHGYFAAPFTNSNAFRTADENAPECEICFVNELNHPPLVCGHNFCSECWNSTLFQRVKNRPTQPITCIGTLANNRKCPQKISEEALRLIGVKPSTTTAWRRELARSFMKCVEGNGDSVINRTLHCKNSLCSAVISLPAGSNAIAITCEICGFSFCCKCDFPAPHSPCTCKMIAEWQEKNGFIEASEEDMVNWLAIKKLSKNCPKCNHAIIKTKDSCNHMTCLVSASGCGAHFCYLCGSDWDQSAYKCTNSSCASGGRSGDIYSTNTDGVTTSEFDRLNEECAGHLAALRASQSIATNLSFDPLNKSSSCINEFRSSQLALQAAARDALVDASQVLVDTFRYLANGCVLRYCLPRDSLVTRRLLDLQGPLQRHSARTKARLTEPTHEQPLNVSVLCDERERQKLAVLVSTIRKELDRCDAELLPLITAYEHEIDSTSKTSTSDVQTTAMPSRAVSEGSGGAGGAHDNFFARARAAGVGPGLPLKDTQGTTGGREDNKATIAKDDNARIPCELCNRLIKVKDFHSHIEKHGVTLEDAQEIDWRRGKPSPREQIEIDPSSPQFSTFVSDIGVGHVEPPKAPGFGGLARAQTTIVLSKGPALEDFKLLDEQETRHLSSVPSPSGTKITNKSIGSSTMFSVGAKKSNIKGKRRSLLSKK